MDMSRPAVCLVTGPSGSGKTTLIEGLVRELRARGFGVATVKHHRGPVEVDRPGKDTWRHRRAGALATFFVTKGEVVMFRDRPDVVGPGWLASLCPPEVHVLLVEGFKDQRGWPRIEVVRRGRERSVPWDEEVLCVATDLEGLGAPCPAFALDDVRGIADLLERRLLSGGS